MLTRTLATLTLLLLVLTGGQTQPANPTVADPDRARAALRARLAAEDLGGCREAPPAPVPAAPAACADEGQP
jgi:hypothetical protein